MVSTPGIYVITWITWLVLICRIRRDGWLSWPGWLYQSGQYTTKWSHVNHRSGFDQGKSVSQRPTSKPLSHAANAKESSEKVRLASNGSLPSTTLTGGVMAATRQRTYVAKRARESRQQQRLLPVHIWNATRTRRNSRFLKRGTAYPFGERKGLARAFKKEVKSTPVSYTHLTLPTIYSV